MSDTVKLIIEIPRAEYECAKQRLMEANDVNKADYYKPQWMKETATHKMDGYISNGIPLDDVKAEIDTKRIRKNPKNDFIDGYNLAMFEALEIIDKHIGTAESEDKE